MRQLTVENELRDVVSRIILQVQLATSQGRTDINLALEDAFIPILKSVYNLPNLINLNRKKKNFPGIDLGDDHDRVAFQVTSTTSLGKVKETVKQFMDRKYYNSFDELYVLTLTPKQASYSQPAVDNLLTEEFSFSCKKHIIDLSDLLDEVTRLRLAAQERVLREFEHILGEVDAFISFSTQTVETPTTITSNLQRIELPKAVYVADLDIDDKAVVARAKAELDYKGRSRNRRSTVKMALLLEGIDTDAWVYHGGKLFAFLDMEQSGLAAVVDVSTLERLETTDLADSLEADNVNVLKQLLTAETQERLKSSKVRMHARDRFFFFGPVEEAQTARDEAWVGKRKSSRRVYRVVQQKKDPSKIAHHQHLSFDLSFSKIGDDWYAQIVPSWYYTFDGYRRSNWHDKELSRQKRLEHNSSVRNGVRFVAYFLSHLTQVESEERQLRFGSLVEFETMQSVETQALADPVNECVEEDNAHGADEDVA